MALARPAPLHATKARDVERPLEKAWWCALCRHAPISSSAFPSSFSACGSVVLCHRLPLPTACQTVVRKTGNCFTRYGSTQTLVQGRARRSRLLPCPQNQFKRRSLQLVVGTTSSRDQDIQFKAPRGYITMWQCLPDTPVVVAVFNASPAVGRHLQCATTLTHSLDLLCWLLLAFGAQPIAHRLLLDPHTFPVEPLVLTIVVVACHHVAEADALAEAVFCVIRLLLISLSGNT